MKWLAAVVVFCAALIIYFATLAPTVTFVDSGELITAAARRGNAHPPGFPLYLILANVATLIPMGTIAQRVNAFSAACAALASSVIAVIAWEIIASARRRQLEPLPSLIIAIAAGLSFASSATIWSYATVAEVYALNALLIAAILLLLIQEVPRVNFAAFLFGLGLGVHHVTVVLCLPALAMLVARAYGRHFFWSRRMAIAFLFCLLGALVYIYLPLASLGNPVLDWGEPRTLRRFLWHITGRQYQAFFALSAASMATQIEQFVRGAWQEWGAAPLVPLLAIIGAFMLFSRRLGFVVVLFLVDIAFVSVYEIAEDKDAYSIPAKMALLLMMVLALSVIIARLHSPRARMAASVAALLLPALAFAGNLPFNNRRHFFAALDHVDNVLRTVSPGSLVLTFDWQFYSPLLYRQEIERWRDDVTVVDINLLRRTWYVDGLIMSSPALVARSRDEWTAYRDELDRWEHDPQAYARHPALSRRIQARFEALIDSFVAQQLALGRAYMTADAAMLRGTDDGAMIERLSQRYRIVRDGLVFRFGSEPASEAPAVFHLRGVSDGTMRFHADDVVNTKILPQYRMMMANLK